MTLQTSRLLVKNEAMELSNQSIAVAVNIFDEPLRQVEECFNRIAENLPSASVGVSWMESIDQKSLTWDGSTGQKLSYK